MGPLENSGRMRNPTSLCYAFGKMDEKNKLYFGDNLKTLRDYVATESVDLIPQGGTRPSTPAPPTSCSSGKRGATTP